MDVDGIYLTKEFNNLNDCLAAQCVCVRGVIGIPADEELSETQRRITNEPIESCDQ